MTEPVAVRRIEVFTGAGRRRRWSREEKVRIVAESCAASDTVSAVARRHGLDPAQLFSWRRTLRREAGEPLLEPMFAPVVVEPATVSPAHDDGLSIARPQPRLEAVIELEIDGVTVAVGRDAPASTITAVVRALRAAR